jgi:hypothetical protein
MPVAATLQFPFAKAAALLALHLAFHLEFTTTNASAFTERKFARVGANNTRPCTSSDLIFRSIYHRGPQKNRERSAFHFLRCVLADFIALMLNMLFHSGSFSSERITLCWV